MHRLRRVVPGCLLAVALAACSLNPQPLPPDQPGGDAASAPITTLDDSGVRRTGETGAQPSVDATGVGSLPDSGEDDDADGSLATDSGKAGEGGTAKPDGSATPDGASRDGAWTDGAPVGDASPDAEDAAPEADGQPAGQPDGQPDGVAPDGAS